MYARGLVGARHRGGVRRRTRAVRAVEERSVAGDRTAVGGLSGLRDPRSVEQDVVYLFVDGIAERLHLGQPREAVLAAWGITEPGQKVLLGLLPGTKEDTVDLQGVPARSEVARLVDPLLAVTDGAPGLIRAVEEVFPRSLRQRCLAHRIRNLETKVPAELWHEVKGRRRMRRIPAASPVMARLTRDEFVKRYETRTADRRRDASSTTSRRASLICACRSRIGGRSAPPTCSSGCSAKSGAARK